MSQTKAVGQTSQTETEDDIGTNSSNSLLALIAAGIEAVREY